MTEDLTGRVVGRRIVGDWFDDEIPQNVRIHPTTHLFSAYAFNHCRSRRSVAVRVADNTGLYDGTMFELGEHGQVDIGSYCVINGATFAGNAHVRIGSYCYLSYEVFLSDGPFTTPANAADPHDTASSIIVGDDCWIGMRSVLLPGAQLGNGAIVGAGSLVDFEVPEYAVVAGNPATIVGWSPPGGRRDG